MLKKTRTGKLSDRFNRYARQIFVAVAVLLSFIYSTNCTCTAETNEEVKLVVNKGHSNDVTSIDFSPDGTKLVSGSHDESVKIWDVASGRELKTLEGPVGQIKCVVFSPDGNWIAAGDDDTNISIWNAKSGKRVRLIEEHNDWITGLSFSPDGKSLASSSDDGTVRVFSFPAGRRKLKLPGHAGNVKSVAFSLDGTLIASSGVDNTVRIWDVAKGEALKIVQHNNLFTGNVLFFPGSKRLAVTNGTNWTVDVLDVETGKLEKSFGKDCCLERMGLSKDGSSLATIKGGSVAIWNTETGQKIRNLPECTEPIKCVAFHQNGKLVATSGGDGSIRIWNLSNGRLEKNLSGGTLPTSAMVLSSDGKTLATGCEDSKVRLWDLDSRDDLRVFSGHEEWVESVALSNDGELLASGGWDRNIRIWDTISGAEKHKFADLPYSIHKLAISKEGSRLAVAAWGLANNSVPSIQVYDLPQKKVVSSCCPGYEAQDLSLSPDGKHLLTGHVGNFACIWEVETGKKVWEKKGFVDSVNRVAYNPDGSSFVCCAYDTLKLFKIDGELLYNLATPDSVIQAFAYSRDGRFFATGHSDNVIRIWDAKSNSQKPLKILEGHSYYITSLVFGKDGKWLASSAGDGFIKFWNINAGKEICSAIPIGKNDWAVVDPFGRFDASNLDNLTYLFWRFTDRKTKAEQMLPVDVFMRQYYTPRLLARLLNGETLPSIPSISKLNRLLPDVRIVSAESRPDVPNQVDVTIAFKNVTGTTGGATGSSGVYDVRLLRDGQLVAYLPKEESFAEQESKDISEGVTGKEIRKTFSVTLPHIKEHTFKFTAYAFNNDKVKSASDEVDYLAKTMKADIPGKAIVVGIGVNEYDDPSWNLRYAVNDARGFTEDLANAIRNTGKYADVATIAVVSDRSNLLKPTDVLATKANIKSLFAALAGFSDESETNSKFFAQRITKVCPDDALIVSISSHGDTDSTTGEYYIFSCDIGGEQKNGLTAELKTRAISSSELTDWLRDVDAGDIAMIIDACHSGAAEGKDFRPGPMDSRGLGQLAYYKRMRILSASQSDATAKERSDLKHGLLSYALLVRGLKEARADVYPTDGRVTLSKWLRYGEREVPKIDRGVNRDYVAEKVVVPINKTRPALQIPKLLDFARKRTDILIMDTRLK